MDTMELKQIRENIDKILKVIPQLNYKINITVRLECASFNQEYDFYEFNDCFNDIYNDWIDWYNYQLNEEVEENAKANGKR